jgi:hypothetical protein
MRLFLRFLDVDQSWRKAPIAGSEAAPGRTSGQSAALSAGNEQPAEINGQETGAATGRNNAPGELFLDYGAGRQRL